MPPPLRAQYCSGPHSNNHYWHGSQLLRRRHQLIWAKPCYLRVQLMRGSDFEQMTCFASHRLVVCAHLKKPTLTWIILSLGYGEQNQHRDWHCRRQQRPWLPTTTPQPPQPPPNGSETTNDVSKSAGNPRPLMHTLKCTTFHSSLASNCQLTQAGSGQIGWGFMEWNLAGFNGIYRMCFLWFPL